MHWAKAYIKLFGLLVLSNGLYGLFTGAAIQFPGSRSGDIAWITRSEYPTGFWIYVLVFLIAGIWLLVTDFDQ